MTKSQGGWEAARSLVPGQGCQRLEKGLAGCIFGRFGLSQFAQAIAVDGPEVAVVKGDERLRILLGHATNNESGSSDLRGLMGWRRRKNRIYPGPLPAIYLVHSSQRIGSEMGTTSTSGIPMPCRRTPIGRHRPRPRVDAGTHPPPPQFARTRFGAIDDGIGRSRSGRCTWFMETQ